MRRREPDRKAVAVICGRDKNTQQSIFSFLRAIGLQPFEWGHLISETNVASPYIGNALDAAFSKARAIVAVHTPDDMACLRAHLRGKEDPIFETQLTGQARPNVLFEAGMAMGHNPERTILVEIGKLRPYSDISGRHLVRLTNDSAPRNELAERLKKCGCAVNRRGEDWLTIGDFSVKAVTDPITELGVTQEAWPASRNLRGVPLVEAVRTVGLVDIESRNEGDRHLPPEKFYAWPGLRDLVISGISAASSFQNHLALIKHVLDGNKDVYFLICREDTSALDHVSKLERRNVRKEIEQVREVIKAEHLARNKRFHVRAFKELPTFTAVMINGDVEGQRTPRGAKAVIRVQPRRMESTHHDGIVLQFTNTGRELDGFSLFAADLRAQWKKARPW